MARSILAALQTIKSEIARLLDTELIHSLCQAVGHVWRKPLPHPFTTVHLFVQQIPNGNAACRLVNSLANPTKGVFENPEEPILRCRP